MSFQLTDNDWSIKVDKSFSVNKSSLLGSFASPLMIIFCVATHTEPGWKQGGSIAQKIPFKETQAFGEFKDIKLNSLTLFEFPFFWRLILRHLFNESINCYSICFCYI